MEGVEGKLRPLGKARGMRVECEMGIWAKGNGDMRANHETAINDQAARDILPRP